MIGEGVDSDAAEELQLRIFFEGGCPSDDMINWSTNVRGGGGKGILYIIAISLSSPSPTCKNNDRKAFWCTDVLHFKSKKKRTGIFHLLSLECHLLVA